MALIRAPGNVTTEMPTLVPVTGCRRVTDAVPVSGAGGGEAVGVGVGDAVGEAAAAMGAAAGADEQSATASTTKIAIPAAAINLCTWPPRAWVSPPVISGHRSGTNRACLSCYD
jgi:hypothetical protein